MINCDFVCRCIQYDTTVLIKLNNSIIHILRNKMCIYGYTYYNQTYPNHDQSDHSGQPSVKKKYPIIIDAWKMCIVENENQQNYDSERTLQRI